MAKHLDRIRELLDDYGAQQKVHEATGIPLRTVGAYKRGEIDPPADRMEQIAEALGKQIVVADQ